MPTSQRPRVLIVTGDTIGARIAGPAIRVLSIAQHASAFADVTVVSFVAAEHESDDFRVLAIEKGDVPAMLALLDAHDVVVLQGNAMHVFGELVSTDTIVVADVYDPMNLAFLEQFKHLPDDEYERRIDDVVDVMTVQLRRADFIVCASEQQRSYYLGMLASLGRLNARSYRRSSDLRGLIDVVPFGLDPAAPVRGDVRMRGQLPGVGPDDTVLLWSGGLYDWFDPHVLVRAVARVAERHDDLRLVFMGVRHPNPDIPEMQIVRSTRELAAELGVEGSSVIFNERWVPFADRAGFLLDADAGVSTHPVHIETAYSFRTRILDYLWAGLPMLVTEGDFFAEIVEREALGIVVPAGDVDALEEAIERLLYDDELREACTARVRAVREQFQWDRTLEPLMAFLADPRPAADRERVMRSFGIGVPAGTPRDPGAPGTVQILRNVLRAEGVGGVARRALARLARR